MSKKSKKKRTSKNMHEGHEASCFCCRQFVLAYEADWSDVTPGEGLNISCWVGKFQTVNQNNIDNCDFHSLVRQGAKCDQFEPTER